MQETQWSARHPGWAGLPAHWLELLAWAASPLGLQQTRVVIGYYDSPSVRIKFPEGSGCYLSLCPQGPR